MAKQVESKKKAVQVDTEVLKDLTKNFVSDVKWPVTVIVVALLFAWILDKHIVNLHWDWQLILQYIGVLRWPIVVLIVLFVLRPHLPALVKKLRKAGWGKTFAEFDPEQPTPDSDEEQTLKIVANENVTTADSVQAGTTPAASSQQPPTDDDVLANKDVQILFGRIYRDMYGTQLEALKLLNSYPNGLSEDDLKPLLETHQKAAPRAYPNVLTLMNYLASFGLIERAANTNLYKIAYAGKLFLEYLTREGVINNFKAF